MKTSANKPHPTDVVQTVAHQARGAAEQLLRLEDGGPDVAFPPGLGVGAVARE